MPFDLSRDIDAVRQLFPVTQHKTYLLNAAQSPLNLRVRSALDSYLDLSATDLGKRPAVREPVKDLLAKLLGGAPSDYAVTTSTGAGISMVAAGLPWQAGDNAILPMGEHWSSTFPWLNLKSRGVETRLVQPDADGRVQIADIAARVDKNTKVICVTAVRFDTGFRSDLKALSALAHANNALLVVDGTQGAGASEINIVDDGIDILACAGFKWLLGMSGIGFLYVNARARKLVAPVAPGMFSAAHDFTELNFHDDARRYETGTLAYVLLYGWIAGLQLLDEIGIANIAARNLMLTDRILNGLADIKVKVLTPAASFKERSAIVTFSVGNNASNKVLFERLEAENVQVSLRTNGLRISPNFFNTEAEIDRFLNLL